MRTTKVSATLAIKYEKDKKVSVYDKVIPSETQIVAFAAQPLKIQAKDKSGNIMRNDQGDILMVRSGLKGTRKDGITKNITKPDGIETTETQ